MDDMLTIDEVTDIVPFSRNSLRKMYETGDFPKPVRLSTRKLRWLRSEVDAWLEARKETRDEDR